MRIYPLRNQSRRIARLLCLAVALFALPHGLTAQERLTAEQVLARHLESIGPAETRESITSRVIIGTTRFNLRTGGVGQAEGNVVMASEGTKSLIGMAFSGSDYPAERIGFDGRTLTTGYVRPGERSSLGNFLLMHDVIFKEGLFGGALSAAWPLLDLAGRQARLDYSGTRRLGERETHVLRYNPRGGSEMTINLFFDAETFQHVRTEYNRNVAARIGSGGVDSSAGQRETRYQMVEEFSDFRRTSGLTLPHTYQFSVSIESSGGRREFSWTQTFSRFAFNQRVEAGSFNVQNAN